MPRLTVIAALLIVAAARLATSMTERHLRGYTRVHFNPVNTSFLHYMTELKQRNAHRLQEACNNRVHTATVYYRVVYMKQCSHLLTRNVGKDLPNPTDSFDRFCTMLKNYYEANAASYARIDKMAEEFHVYGPGSIANQRHLAYLACKNIDDYDHHCINGTQYSEWFIHTIPFSLPVACGYSYKAYNKTCPSSYDCLGDSGKIALYATLVIDGLIVVCIFVANVAVLMVLLQKSVMRNVHGLYRVNLACADLLIGCVLSASMNTTNRMYMGPHKFLKDGEKPSMTDYHSKLYVDAFGFFTVFSFAVSVFTLTTISFERYFRERKCTTCRVKPGTKRIVTLLTMTIIWIVPFLIAIYPIFDPGLPYTITALGVIIAPNFYLAYAISLGISLLLVWILNVMLFVTTRRNQHETGNTKNLNGRAKSDKMKKQINKHAGERSKSFHDVEGKVLQTISPLSEVSATETRCMSEKAIAASAEEATPSISAYDCEKSCDILKSGERECEAQPQRVATDWEKVHDSTIVKTIRVVVVAFTLAILPSIAVMLWGLSVNLDPESLKFNPVQKTAWNSLAYLASRVLFANSFFNVIIYSYTNPMYWRATKRLLLKGRCCSSQSSK